MRNISIFQLVVVVFIGTLLFSDFSKITKGFWTLTKKNNSCKKDK